MIPVPPGPKPKSKCSREYHIRLNEEQAKAIDNMGAGKPVDKILYLIEKQGELQFPESKRLLKARYVLLRDEAMQKSKLVQTFRLRMIEFGFTEKEIRAIEDEEMPRIDENGNAEFHPAELPRDYVMPEMDPNNSTIRINVPQMKAPIGDA